MQTETKAVAATTAMRPARIAVFGLGRMGSRHAEIVAGSGAMELVAVADGAPDRARQVGEAFGAVAADGLAELLALEPDGLIVATPSPTHAATIELAAAHGVNIFCEKPLAPDGPSARRALDAVEAAAIKLQVGFQMRFDADLARLQQLVANGEIGTPYQFHARLRDVAAPSRDYLASSGGYFWDGAIHCFDLARWMLGEVVEVTAFGAALSSPLFEQLGDVDNAMTVLRFASGALGLVEVSRVAAYGFDSAVEVLGAGGSVRVAGALADGLEHRRDGQLAHAHVQDFIERFAGAYPHELEAFARCVADPDASPAVTGEDGIAAMRIAHAATESYRRRETIRIADVPW